tara:strand:+ start:18586 stop:19143 length:558 start_codon:yes stop_codon:yes gene_type:complete
MIQFKSFNGLTSLVLGGGLIATNFMSLNLLARKDSGIPDIAKLSSTPYSSIQIRSETKPDGAEEWIFNSKQHDPKLVTTITDDSQPTFNGGVKKKYTHKQDVAQFAIYPKGSDGKLTADQISCIEKMAQGRSNGQLIADAGSVQVTPAIAGIPILGPVLAGLWFGQSRKAVGNLASDLAGQWNDC